MSAPGHSSLTPCAQEFVASVLHLAPRIAAFDCDGTLWSGDAGEEFFYWEMEQGLLPERVARWARQRYEQYRAGQVSEIDMCGEMVSIHAGIGCDLLQRAADTFFGEHIAARIFPEMAELTRRLEESGCELWAVSSTNDWVIRAAAPRFGIPPERIIAACVHTEAGCATERLIRVPTDELKASAIRELLPRTPDAAFGNSVHDAAMLELAEHSFAINPNPDLEQMARERGWRVYYPEVKNQNKN